MAFAVDDEEQRAAGRKALDDSIAPLKPALLGYFAGRIDPGKLSLLERKPALLGYFAGRIDPGKLSLLERAAIKMAKSPVGDFRDWDAVRDWTKKVAESMDQDTAGTSGENRKP